VTACASVEASDHCVVGVDERVPRSPSGRPAAVPFRGAERSNPLAPTNSLVFRSSVWRPVPPWRPPTTAWSGLMRASRAPPPGGLRLSHSAGAEWSDPHAAT